MTKKYSVHPIVQKAWLQQYKDTRGAGIPGGMQIIEDFSGYSDGDPLETSPMWTNGDTQNSLVGAVFKDMGGGNWAGYFYDNTDPEDFEKNFAYPVPMPTTGVNRVGFSLNYQQTASPDLEIVNWVFGNLTQAAIWVVISHPTGQSARAEIYAPPGTFNAKRLSVSGSPINPNGPHYWEFHFDEDAQEVEIYFDGNKCDVQDIATLDYWQTVTTSQLGFRFATDSVTEDFDAWMQNIRVDWE